MLPSKIAFASVTPSAIAPSPVIVPALMKAGDFLATDPTLAASIADCSLLRTWVARL